MQLFTLLSHHLKILKAVCECAKCVDLLKDARCSEQAEKGVDISFERKESQMEAPRRTTQTHDEDDTSAVELSNWGVTDRELPFRWK